MSAATPRPPQVLIVEDDPGNALVMKTILVRLGRMAVVVSEDGDQVLAWIAAGHVDAVEGFADRTVQWRHPGVSGGDVSRIAQRHVVHARVGRALCAD